MWRSGRIVQVKVCGYFALVNSSLDSLLGKRSRTKEKVSVLFEPSFFWTFPVFPSNSRTFRRYSRWSFIARQCTVTGWLRRVHLPHRERSRHAFHHPVWMIPGGKSLKRDRQSVFCTAVNPMYTHQHQEEVQYDLDKPRIAVYKNKWRIHQNTEKVVQFETRQRKGLQFYRRRSNAITLFNTVPAICIEKVAHMKIGEELYCKVHQSPRLPRAALTPNLHHGCQDLSNPEARTSADHQSERSAKHEETRRGNVDYRIQRIPHSTVRGGDSNRKEIVEKLIQQFETHPNRDSLIEDLNQTEEFNPFSEKSKELITSMGNTEIFELCETSSKKQCPDCALIVFLYWEVGIVKCTCGKCMQPSERNRQLDKARYDVLSIPGHVIAKNPSHGARHGPSLRQYMCHKTHEMLKKAHKHDYKHILDRWCEDDKYRKSLSDIWWNEEGIMKHDKSALEDHSYTSTREEVGTNAAGVQGPLTQRGDS